ncbi:SLC13 family permease [Parvimonas micra]|uniref:SLC13 family permease n=1 Tax=Parvimonas micra TaxID=33033 RepID=UPI002420056F|nr:SLC13 family permease [Parvimonas micra]
MEMLSYISLTALIIAIILGFFRKTNVGIIAIGMTFLLGKYFGIKDKDIIKGFSSSLFLTMAGVSYLFGLLMTNNTLENLSAKIVSATGKNKILLPIIIFLLGALLCAVGPGAIPTLAIMPIIAVPIAVASGYNPVMLTIIAQCGVMGARMSPLTPEAAVVIDLMSNQNLDTNMLPIFLCHLLTGLLISVFAFIYYKGWKLDKNIETIENKKIIFNKEQTLSLIALLILIVSVIMFKVNVGLMAFTIGTILVLLGAGDEKKAISKIPWNVILLVLGVGILMNIVSLSGGITLMAEGMTNIMSAKTAPSIMAISASIMSFFSSGLGVVFPTLIPTSSIIANNLGIGAYVKELVAMVTVGGTFAGISPISTTGALIMSAVISDEQVKDKFPQNKLFLELVFWAFFTILLEVILAYLGVYKLFF